MNRSDFLIMVQTYLLACMFNGYYKGSANKAMQVLTEDVASVDMNNLNNAFDSAPPGSKWVIITEWCDWKLGRAEKPEWA